MTPTDYTHWTDGDLRAETKRAHAQIENDPALVAAMHAAEEAQARYEKAATAYDRAMAEWGVIRSRLFEEANLDALWEEGARRWLLAHPEASLVGRVESTVWVTGYTPEQAKAEANDHD